MTYTFKLSRRLAVIRTAALALLALGACKDGGGPGSLFSDTMDIDASRIASVTLAPDTATLTVGETRQFAAVTVDTRGEVISRAATWRSLDSLTASVSSAGLVRARRAGTTGIVASLRSRADTAWVLVRPDTTAADTLLPPPDTTVPPPDTSTGTPPPDTNRVGWYVYPNGSGDGSRARPWSLSYALAGAGGRIQPGDTVWILGATYHGTFRGAVSGTTSAPVVLRAYPGHRAQLDGTLRLDGHDLVVWGLEIMRSAPSGEVASLEMRGARQRAVNNVIHDGAQQGITFWDEAVDSEIYGNIVYNQGIHENLDHGTYVHNTTGTKVIQDNVFFNNLAYGIHVYASPGNATQRNVHVLGNVSFNNGTISTRYTAKGNIIMGAEPDVPGEGMRVLNNLTYFSGSSGENVRVGYLSPNRDITVSGNLIYGGSTGLRVDDWSSATVQNNTIGGPNYVVNLNDYPTGHAWSGNRYYRSSSAAAFLSRGTALTLAAWQTATGLGTGDVLAGSVPSTTQVFVKANRYESGRALVVVYNFGQQGSVAADLSGILAVGQRYVVKNVQDFFGAPVAAGTYGGGSITLPMTGVAAPPRLGRTTPTPPRTGPYFDTFVVLPQ